MIRDIEVAEKLWKKTNDPEDARELLDVIFEHYLTLRGKQKKSPYFIYKTHYTRINKICCIRFKDIF